MAAELGQTRHQTTRHGAAGVAPSVPHARPLAVDGPASVRYERSLAVAYVVLRVLLVACGVAVVLYLLAR
jgi:hypothetical protein